MIDCRLIQNDTEIRRYYGDKPPAGWHWYNEPLRRYARISGTYVEAKASPVEEAKTGTGEVRVRATIYSRIVGYYAPVNLTWNEGKRQEFRERKTYNIERSLNHVSQNTG